jgi:hypothetical protein
MSFTQTFGPAKIRKIFSECLEGAVGVSGSSYGFLSSKSWDMGPLFFSGYISTYNWNYTPKVPKID